MKCIIIKHYYTAFLEKEIGWANYFVLLIFIEEKKQSHTIYDMGLYVLLFMRLREMFC